MFTIIRNYRSLFLGFIKNNMGAEAADFMGDDFSDLKKIKEYTTDGLDETEVQIFTDALKSGTIEANSEAEKGLKELTSSMLERGFSTMEKSAYDSYKNLIKNSTGTDLPKWEDIIDKAVNEASSWTAEGLKFVKKSFHGVSYINGEIKVKYDGFGTKDTLVLKYSDKTLSTVGWVKEKGEEKNMQTESKVDTRVLDDNIENAKKLPELQKLLKKEIKKYNSLVNESVGTKFVKKNIIESNTVNFDDFGDVINNVQVDIQSLEKEIIILKQSKAIEGLTNVKKGLTKEINLLKGVNAKLDASIRVLNTTIDGLNVKDINSEAIIKSLKSDVEGLKQLAQGFRIKNDFSSKLDDVLLITNLKELKIVSNKLLKRINKFNSKLTPDLKSGGLTEINIDDFKNTIEERVKEIKIQERNKIDKKNKIQNNIEPIQVINKKQKRAELDTSITMSSADIQKLYGENVHDSNDSIDTAEKSRKERVNKLINKYRGKKGVKTLYEKNNTIKKLYDTTINISRKSTLLELNTFEEEMNKVKPTIDKVKKLKVKKNNTEKNNTEKNNIGEGKINIKEANENSKVKLGKVGEYIDSEGNPHEINLEKSYDAATDKDIFHLELDGSTGWFRSDIKTEFTKHPTEKEIKDALNGVKETPGLMKEYNDKNPEISLMKKAGINADVLTKLKENSKNGNKMSIDGVEKKNELHINRHGPDNDLIIKEENITDEDGKISIKLNKNNIAKDLIKIDKFLILLDKAESKFSKNTFSANSEGNISIGTTFSEKSDSEKQFDDVKETEIKDIMDLNIQIKNLEKIILSDSEKMENKTLEGLGLDKLKAEKLAESIGSTYTGTSGEAIRFDRGGSNDLLISKVDKKIVIKDDHEKVDLSIKEGGKKAIKDIDIYLDAVDSVANPGAEGYTGDKLELQKYLSRQEQITNIKDLNKVIKGIKNASKENSSFENKEKKNEKSLEKAAKELEKAITKNEIITIEGDGEHAGKTFEVKFKLEGKELILDSTWDQPGTDKSIILHGFNHQIGLNKKQELMRQYKEQVTNIPKEEKEEQ